MNLSQAVETTLKSFRADIPDYVASGLVDMSTGMLLDVDTADEHPREIIDLLAAATADLFQGKTISQIEGLWRRQRGSGEATGGYFEEIAIYSDSLAHLFLRSKRHDGIVAAVVCRPSVDVVELFAQAQQVMDGFDKTG